MFSVTQTKELPSDFRKKIARLETSRDNLKDKNREKADSNKILRDRNVEIQNSRDEWRKKWKEQTLENAKLEENLKVSQKETEEERARAERELKRAEASELQLEELRKKKPGS